MGSPLSLFLFYILPKWTFLGLSLRAVSAHFWPLRFFIPRRVYLTQWYPYGVPFESLSLLYPPRWTFLGFNLQTVSAHFWPPRFFILTDGWMGDGRMVGQAKSKIIMYFQHLSKTIRYFFLVVSRPLRRLFKTFSDKNSRKKKSKNYEKLFFSAIVSFFFQKKWISQKLFDTFFKLFLFPLEMLAK